ncbi:hypothetical protein ACFLS9_03505 [Bacteroidota bacterium]
MLTSGVIYTRLLAGRSVVLHDLGNPATAGQAARQVEKLNLSRCTLSACPDSIGSNNLLMSMRG